MRMLTVVTIVLALLQGALQVAVTGDATAKIAPGERLVCQVVAARDADVSLYCQRRDAMASAPVYVYGASSALLNRYDGLDCTAAASERVALTCSLITRAPGAYTMPGYIVYLPMVTR